MFLEQSAARVINTDNLRLPKPNCAVCGVTQSRLVVDTNRATLNDLVEGVLKTQLGYGEEFTINNEVGTLYDPELDDNLLKKFSDLGIKADSFLTVVDDDEENPRVNLSLSISEQLVACSPAMNSILMNTDPCLMIPDQSYCRKMFRLQGEQNQRYKTKISMARHHQVTEMRRSASGVSTK